MDRKKTSKARLAGAQAEMLTQASASARRTRAGSVEKGMQLLQEPKVAAKAKPARDLVDAKQLVISPSRKKVHYETIYVEAGAEEIVLRIVIGTAPVTKVMMLSSNNDVSEVP